jgi:DNA polymerase I-like protein with 3'-5' exonuclease and polymerase domains
MAERVIQAGTISLKKMAEFSMASIAGRHFGLLIDKTMQETFDLESPLTQEQIEYAAFDVRFPHAMRQAQMNIMTADQLLATAQIENDAIGTFTDMHLVGQNLDDAKWVERIKHVIERRIGELKILDEGFLPYVGNKHEQIDEAAITAAELVWRTGFEVATPREAELAAQKRLEKDKTKKAEIGLLLKAEEQKRAAAKAAARKACSALTKHRTAVNKKLEKCEGEAFINFDSQSQLLEALQKMPGMKNIQDVQDDTLLKFNDRPLIQTLRKYKKGKKETGTYGMTWCQRWITKPLSKEGWRHPVDGRLHCQFNQLSAETGRTSSEKPNAQNLPKDDEVRACFIASPYDKDEPDGYSIVTVDMSGAELRIIAELANATTWITAFNKGWDVHSVSTEILEPLKWPSLALKDCAYYALDENGELRRQKCKCPGHGELRQKTKSINFMLCYGGGPDALADELGITVDAAKELMHQHEAAFPDVWGYLDRSGKLAQATREARDMFGRRRSFPEPTEEMAKEWYESENKEKLELPENVQETNIFNFKASQLREPTKIEEYKLTHRSPDWKEIRQAMRALNGSIGRRGKNHCIQGSNASIIKRAMGCGVDKDGKFYLWHTLPQYKAKIVNMVHDEIVLECPKRFGQKVADLVADAFARAAAEVMSKVKMTADFHIADRWMK